MSQVSISELMSYDHRRASICYSHIFMGELNAWVSPAYDTHATCYYAQQMRSVRPCTRTQTCLCSLLGLTNMGELGAWVDTTKLSHHKLGDASVTLISPRLHGCCSKYDAHWKPKYVNYKIKYYSINEVGVTFSN